MSQAARHFAAATTAAVEAAFLAAFRDGVEEACAEVEDDDCDWETLLGGVAQERTRLYTTYAASVTRMAGDLNALLAEQRGALLQMTRAGFSQAQIDTVQRMLKDGSTQEAILNYLIANGYDRDLALGYMQRLFVIGDRLRRTRAEIDRRLKTLFDGVAWAAAELGRAAVMQGRGEHIYWVLDPAVKNCGGCVGLASGSPYASIAAIGTVPGQGDTPCRFNCRCHLERR